MTLSNKIFLSGEWIFFSLRKTSGDPMKFDFQLTLTDDGHEADNHVCFFRDIDGLSVDSLRLAPHLSLEIKRLKNPWPPDMRFGVTELEACALDFKCTHVEINGCEF